MSMTPKQIVEAFELAVHNVTLGEELQGTHDTLDAERRELADARSRMSRLIAEYESMLSRLVEIDEVRIPERGGAIYWESCGEPRFRDGRRRRNPMTKVEAAKLAHRRRLGIDFEENWSRLCDRIRQWAGDAADELRITSDANSIWSAKITVPGHRPVRTDGNVASDGTMLVGVSKGWFCNTVISYMTFAEAMIVAEK